MMAGLRTVAIELLRLMNLENKVAQLELFQDDFEQLITVLKNIGFLWESPFCNINQHIIHHKND